MVVFFCPSRVILTISGGTLTCSLHVPLTSMVSPGFMLLMAPVIVFPASQSTETVAAFATSAETQRPARKALVHVLILIADFSITSPVESCVYWCECDRQLSLTGSGIQPGGLNIMLQRSLHDFADQTSRNIAMKSPYTILSGLLVVIGHANP